MKTTTSFEHRNEGPLSSERVIDSWLRCSGRQRDYDFALPSCDAAAACTAVAASPTAARARVNVESKQRTLLRRCIRRSI